MKKVLFVVGRPYTAFSEKVAALCQITEEKFFRIFDYGSLFPTEEIDWDSVQAVKQVDRFLENSSHPMLVLVGTEVHAAFGVVEQPCFEPFPLADGGTDEAPEQVRLVIKIPSPSDEKFYRTGHNRRLTKSVLGALVAMNVEPASPEDAARCCQAVRAALGDDNIQFFTRKHLTEIEKMIEEGKTVDKVDLGSLMQLYAKDLQFVLERTPQ